MSDNRKNQPQSMDTANRSDRGGKQIKQATEKAENSARGTKDSTNCR